MKIKERLTLIKWRIHHSDAVRYFHLSKWPEIIYDCFIGASLLTILFAVLVGALAACGLIPHPKGLILGVLCTLSIGGFIGFFWGRKW